MYPLAPQHGGEGVRIPGLGGGHHLEEEVVPVATGAHVRLSQRSSSARPAGVIRWTSRSGLTPCGWRSDSIRPSLAVADALLISITERAPELATLRAFGWSEAALRRMVITEGALTGLAGSVAGAALGLAGAAIFARQLPPRLFVAAGAAVAAGVLVTCLAALLPAHLLRRLPAARLLAQE